MNMTIRHSFLVFALITGFATACSNANFTASKGAGSNGVNNPNGGTGDDATGTVNQPCTDTLQQSTIPIKLLFMVDVSGSNASDPGTDKNKVVRGQSIQEFFNTYKTKTNFSWDLQVFSGSTASPLITTFTNNTTTMQQAINNFFNLTDDGQTPYMAALNLIQSTLTADTARTQQTKWVVVFMSDGMPNPNVDQTTLNNKVSSIVGVIPGQVSFNTVYYGPADQAAVARLQSMATSGGGKFLNTNNNGRSFPIEDVITIPGTSCR